MKQEQEFPNQNETDRTEEVSLFFELYSVNKNVFYHYIASRIGEDEANDILHNAILSGLKSFYQLKNKLDFTKWFFGVVKNTLKVHWRNKTTDQNAIQRYRKITINLEKKLIVVDTPEKNIIQTEQIRIVYTALDELSENIRMAFRLHYETGMSFRKIGEIFNVHENTIKKWVKHAKKQLLVCMK
jgi:RNA polymerase sigma factor (sigma-70 family)